MKERIYFVPLTKPEIIRLWKLMIDEQRRERGDTLAGEIDDDAAEAVFPGISNLMEGLRQSLEGTEFDPEILASLEARFDSYITEEDLFGPEGSY
jgi:hypothetical protein